MNKWKLFDEIFEFMDGYKCFDKFSKLEVGYARRQLARIIEEEE